MTLPEDSTRDASGRGLGRLLRVGAPLVGALTGAPIGSSGGLPGGLSGAAGGVMVTESFRAVGGQLESGALSPREQERIGAAVHLAARLVQERLDAGEEVRSDGFFDEVTGGRPISEEVLEGMLRKAAGSYEEKKLPFIAALYANLAFSPEVPAAEAHYALQVADRVTFRQLSLLGLFTVEAHQDDVTAHVGLFHDELSPKLGTEDDAAALKKAEAIEVPTHRRRVENSYLFKSPVNVVLTAYAPERQFVERLLSTDNAAVLKSWVKSPDVGFDSIEYGFQPGGNGRSKRGFLPAV
jgi:hypothetical protein